MWHDLPDDIIIYIYSFDNTFHEVFRDCLSEIKRIKRIYHDNGTICVRYKILENRQKHGLFQTFYQNGILKYQCTYHHDSILGWTQEFYPNGCLWKLFYQKTGLIIGQYYEFFPNGRFATSGFFDQRGRKHGSWIEYQSNGNLLTKTRFDKNIPIQISKFYT